MFCRIKNKRVQLLACSVQFFSSTDPTKVRTKKSKTKGKRKNARTGKNKSVGSIAHYVACLVAANMPHNHGHASEALSSPLARAAEAPTSPRARAAAAKTSPCPHAATRRLAHTMPPPMGCIVDCCSPVFRPRHQHCRRMERTNVVMEDKVG